MQKGFTCPWYREFFFFRMLQVTNQCTYKVTKDIYLKPINLCQGFYLKSLMYSRR